MTEDHVPSRSPNSTLLLYTEAVHHKQSPLGSSIFVSKQ